MVSLFAFAVSASCGGPIGFAHGAFRTVGQSTLAAAIDSAAFLDARGTTATGLSLRLLDEGLRAIPLMIAGLVQGVTRHRVVGHGAGLRCRILLRCVASKCSGKSHTSHYMTSHAGKN